MSVVDRIGCSSSKSRHRGVGLTTGVAAPDIPWPPDLAASEETRTGRMIIAMAMMMTVVMMRLGGELFAQAGHSGH